LDIFKIDNQIRKNNLIDVINKNDEILLKDGLGFTSYEIETLRGIWIKLKNRRINRHKPKIIL